MMGISYGKPPKLVDDELDGLSDWLDRLLDSLEMELMLDELSVLIELSVLNDDPDDSLEMLDCDESVEKLLKLLPDDRLDPLERLDWLEDSLDRLDSLL